MMSLVNSEDPNVPPRPTPPPVPLSYISTRQDSAPPSRLKFWHGLALGILISGIFWFGGLGPLKLFANNVSWLFGGLWILIGLKIIGSIIALSFRGTRPFGAGILTSMALIALIFFGTCAALIAMH